VLDGLSSSRMRLADRRPGYFAVRTGEGEGALCFGVSRAGACWPLPSNGGETRQRSINHDASGRGKWGGVEGEASLTAGRPGRGPAPPLHSLQPRPVLRYSD
jgi:hypothetical protein